MDIAEALEFINKESSAFAEFIREAADAASNEAEFVARMEVGIDRLAQKFGIEILSRKEYTLAVGRADAVYNRFVIEYEPPDSLRDDLSHGHTRHAIEQVRGYIGGLADKEGHKKDRFLGVAFDGRYFIYVRYREGHFHIDLPEAVDVQSTKRFLTRLFSISAERALIPENLVTDFGPQNWTAKDTIKALYHRLEAPGDLTDRLYRQWQLFFSEVAGFDAASGKIKHKKELAALAKGIGVLPKDLDAARFFFALHTYYSFLVKLIAHAALQSIAGGMLGAPTLARMASMDGEILRRRLHELEDGDYFKKMLGIKNLLEGDFFRWYLEEWDDDLERALKNVLGKLADYNPAALQADPYATRDLLKALYHNILPRVIRHDLGEFYTPDWLAERVLNQLGEELYRMPKGKVRVAKTVDKPLLDPACGSGTFLILAIRALKENLRRMGLSEGDILEVIVRNIVGIDLNPMAVMSARVNYLLAILDLMEYRKGDIEIPVYLADSVVTPELGMDLQTQRRIVLKTVVGDLPIPMSVDTREEMDKLTGLLEEYITSEFSTEAFLKAADQTIEPKPGSTEKAILKELYEKLLNLHRRKLDRIWPRIIKNAFMPRFLSGFHYVVGNPPWINWESLPDAYRKDSKELWVKYGLFVHSGMDTILGKGKKDVSTLMALVAIDRYLKPKGKLAFLITQSVWKSAGAAQGFRKFTIPGKTKDGGTPFKVEIVEDLSNLQVFEGASTRTSIFIARKGEIHKYPTPYTLWQKTVKGKGLGYDTSLEDIREMTRRLHFHGQPVNKDDETSSWLTGRKAAIKALQKVLGKSHYRAYEGVNTGGANAVYWVETLGTRPDGNLMITNIIKGAKRKVDQIQTAIEPDLVYPLLRGRDVKRWRAKPSAHLIMAQDPKTRRGIDLDYMQEHHPKTYTYLKRFEPELRERSSQAVRNLMKKGPFYSIFGVGEYTFAPWKVVWREQASSMTAAVISDHEGSLVMPDHKLMLISFGHQKEAHFVCGLLNSSISQSLVLGYAINIQFDPHILEKAGIPQYEQKNKLHSEISHLSSSAHELAQADSNGRLAEVEEAIDQASAQLWGLTEMELADIRVNLAELLWKPGEDKKGDS